MVAFNVYDVFIAKPFQVLPSPCTIYRRAIANIKVIKPRAKPTQAISTRVAGFGERWSVTAPFGTEFHVVVVQ